MAGLGILATLVIGSLALPESELDKVLGPLGATRYFTLASFLFLAIIGLVTGFGMWQGRRWGWWCGCVYFAYGVVTALPAIVAIVSSDEQIAEGFADSAQGPASGYARFTARLAIDALLTVYFFKGNVLAYFGLKEINKWKAIGTIVGIIALIFVASTLLTSMGS